ncbi:MAG TPA: 4-(cytidine 5'-diphospho)-2-C-methyl-D-erythritol kinase [Epsilonproteobacteria bacterium]|nr:4-(cytidine 5'-diphospho)-2-C-methyl-D-erythritol kinase [Campylobacterota bacterium]
MYSIKAHAKINSFLKITGHHNGYHTIMSRFIQLENLYDTISFVPCKCETFTIEGIDGVETKANTIYKAFVALSDYSGNLDLLDFFYHHKVVVTKNIPSQAGLGGGSSNAGAFLRLVNEICDINLETPILANIGSQVGADVPFFVYNYTTANVSGFGEIVEPFDEEPLRVELFYPKTKCDTALVYKTFKQNFFDSIEPQKFSHWKYLPSREVINEADNDPIVLNDLFKAALLAYPSLKNQTPKESLFSGSGSTFFKVLR